MAKIYENSVTKYKITSSFGNRIHPITGKKAHHDGVDIISKTNDKNIYALEEGYVYKIKTGQNKATTGYGNYIWVRYPRINVSIFYAHCKSIKLKKGAKVTKGTIIAIMGTTGASTGVHLHLGMTKIGSNAWINPETYNYQVETKIKNKTGVQKDEDKNQIKVLVDNLRIRKSSNTNSEIVGMSIKNNIYDYYEIVKDENYSWYRIGENEWIANNGKYLEVYEKIPEEIKSIEENKIIEIKEYKFSFIAEKTAIYKIKLNKGEQLIIK